MTTIMTTTEMLDAWIADHSIDQTELVQKLDEMLTLIHAPNNWRDVPGCRKR